MSRTTKRKHVTREVLDEFVLPEKHQQVVQVVAPRGNNLHEVKTSSGDKFLASMPTKFRKNVWIKRGDFVIVDPIEEGDKVKGEIVVILFPKQIKFIQKEGFWPEGFLHSSDSHWSKNDALAEATEELENTSLKQNDEEDSSERDDDDDDLSINTNRPPVIYFSSEASSSEEEQGEEEEEEEEEVPQRIVDKDSESSVDH